MEAPGGNEMPVVEVKWLEGRTKEQKQELARGITELIGKVAGVKPEDLHIIIEDVPRKNWAVGSRFFEE
jgi:4-oxalocrotonate tautomerase